MSQATYTTYQAEVINKSTGFPKCHRLQGVNIGVSFDHFVNYVNILSVMQYCH
jgi:hypothetical protein